jgi:hypothetical protein
MRVLLQAYRGRQKVDWYRMLAKFYEDDKSKRMRTLWNDIRMQVISEKLLEIFSKDGPIAKKTTDMAASFGLVWSEQDGTWKPI